MHSKIMELKVNFRRANGREPKYLICSRDVYYELLDDMALVSGQGSPWASIRACTGLIITHRMDAETGFMDVA